MDVTYGKGSSANSCSNCPNPGGGQFYTDFGQVNHPELKSAQTLDLKYYVKFPTNYDWGKAGKLPGLYGGAIGCESGGNHCGGFSTRYMWRGGNPGEVYFYSPTTSGPTGYGVDLGLGSWHFAADGGWHAIEQQVDRKAQQVTVWYDGKQVLNAKTAGISTIPFSGVFFSTFFGGHDTSWGPKSTVHAYFADFSVSTSVQH
ncbi:sugar isomerase [Solihabitans fulvus]|uniref:Sugar isomerase n=1 Tax=Solihabitans fulvus TaxID=1892852 RepID=A0A5B2XUN3_9PSEU|nr:sugar isomerase [Solihabitans fulvus]